MIRVLASFALFLTFAITVVQAPAVRAAKPEAAPAPRVFGQALGDEDIVPISALLASPEEFVGKTVKVRGRVVAVCQMRGCWMELAGDEEFQKLRIKVEDGVIVFPADAIGHEAIAEGVFTQHALDLEQTKRMVEHRCRERGEAFDPSSVTECEVLYQIQGHGAAIY